MSNQRVFTFFTFVLCQLRFMRKFLYDVRFVFTLIFVWGSCFSIYLPILLSNISPPCQMMFVLLNSNMTGATSGAGIAYTYGDIRVHHRLFGGSCYQNFSVMCNVLYIVVCPFVLFLLAIVLSVLRFTESDYPYLKDSEKQYFLRISRGTFLLNLLASNTVVLLDF